MLNSIIFVLKLVSGILFSISVSFASKLVHPIVSNELNWSTKPVVSSFQSP